MLRAVVFEAKKNVQFLEEPHAHAHAHTRPPAGGSVLSKQKNVQFLKEPRTRPPAGAPA